MKIREAVEAVREEITQPGQDQSIGQWEPGGRCCAGARLAHAMGVSSGNYNQGLDAFAERIGGNRAQLIMMLKAAGAGRDPAGAKDWDDSPEHVWDRVARMEELPVTRGADLQGPT